MREKHLLIDSYTLKDAYYYGSLNNLGFIRARFNPADSLFKDIADETLQLSLLRDDRIEREATEFITNDYSLTDTVNALSGGREVDISLLLEE